MKTLSIVGTRPEIIKMSQIIKRLDSYTDHVLVHTGQNYDKQLKDVFFEDLGLRQPDHYLGVVGDTLGTTIGNVMRETERVLLEEKPDAVVILGDTNSALGAVMAKRLKIPIFHLEAGNRCFDERVPEEINRKIVDHISDVNMVYSENARRNLLDEGIAKDRVFLMGSPMTEVLSKIELPTTNPLGLQTGSYFLVSIHREENVDSDNLTILLETLNKIALKYRLPVIVTAHPRFRKKVDYNLHDLVSLHEPFGFKDYIYLQAHAKCVISDSGTISEESSILKFPAVTIRNAIERQEAVDTGSILITGVDSEHILKCIDIAKRPTVIPQGYEVDNCSERVLRVVLGYTGYVNRRVWHGA